MKKILLYFLLLPLFLTLASVACQDHYVPPVPPAITTLPIDFNVPARVSAVPVYFYLSVQFSALGSEPITEYGVLYSAKPPQEALDATPEYSEAGAGVTKTIFTDTPSLSVSKEFLTTERFDEIYYRAYAKTSTTIVYGDVLYYKRPIPQ